MIAEVILRRKFYTTSIGKYSLACAINYSRFPIKNKLIKTIIDWSYGEHIKIIEESTFNTILVNRNSNH